MAPISFWSAFARVWSASLHCGMPTASMFFCWTSAIGLLRWGGQAEPTIRRVTVVPVMAVAAVAMVLPSSKRSLIFG